MQSRILGWDVEDENSDNNEEVVPDIERNPRVEKLLGPATDVSLELPIPYSSAQVISQGSVSHVAKTSRPADGEAPPSQSSDHIEAGSMQPEHLLSLQQQEKRRRAREDMGKSCGRWSCYTEDIDTIRHRHGWLEGRLITVVAEYLAQKAGENVQAHHTAPLVLWNVRELLDKGSNNSDAALTELYIRKQIDVIRAMPPRRFWVIPAHVPAHWTVVALDWKTLYIRYMHSLINRIGAEDDEGRVQEEVWYLLRLICENFVQDDWQWISEQRPQRQRNSHDCGAFTLADAASYLARGEPSDLTQGDMNEWRTEIIRILDGLAGLQFTIIPTNDPNQPIWDLDPL
ncbi:hypothetical protein M422DRAFT_253525 [Sphaerobolus stellatus SS14]|uniref:Ubiquitin-like protease family profile domain-containing protein n=1 Tax=Sphaerobolus stellatus (strain SS14) TaxID=990650 RepID=A0A0C9VWU8_SPHS4|nr:hypothetical protein M422DRAFT_253525 [Sphaerobolus stellatus SS14]